MLFSLSEPSCRQTRRFTDADRDIAITGTTGTTTAVIAATTANVDGGSPTWGSRMALEAGLTLVAGIADGVVDKLGEGVGVEAGPPDERAVDLRFGH